MGARPSARTAAGDGVGRHGGANVLGAGRRSCFVPPVSLFPGAAGLLGLDPGFLPVHAHRGNGAGPGYAAGDRQAITETERTTSQGARMSAWAEWFEKLWRQIPLSTSRTASFGIS